MVALPDPADGWDLPSYAVFDDNPVTLAAGDIPTPTPTPVPAPLELPPDLPEWPDPAMPEEQVPPPAEAPETTPPEMPPTP